ncbi:DpnD/PcfM family protein [Sinorhizobium meliloti]|uniref:DpnD/PcfM family protein n=1 Tax=Rhizobium meliloti TaxID=382 RepID=UPI0001E4AB6E|nr:DpnD/PcfM family protein [Sinorhizobium meliloti]AEG53162.1 hypothetical protein Sinme_1416 [Sinorhizobium meliloti AK83]MDE4591122.1 DpnD/PcfM family protein [Sinorhizobium meliloti]SEI56346.1 DpnD/PcfM-like protein [Sinorhizobium meliloti]
MKNGQLVEYTGNVPSLSGKRGKVDCVTRNGWIMVEFDHGPERCAECNLKPVQKYAVTITERVSYTVTVEAADSDEAESIARETWLQSENPTADFPTIAFGIEDSDVESAE